MKLTQRVVSFAATRFSMRPCGASLIQDDTKSLEEFDSILIAHNATIETQELIAQAISFFVFLAESRILLGFRFPAYAGLLR